MIKIKFTRFLLLTLGTAILLGGGTAIYWLLVRPYFFAAQKLTGAEFVPQEVIFAASISTNEEKWQQLRLLGTPESQKRIKKYFAHIQDTFLEDNGYSYKTHIQPWVGEEITIAYLGANQPNVAIPNTLQPEKGKQPIVIILPVETPVRAGQLLDSPNSDVKSKKLRRTYQGVEIEEIQNSQKQNYSLTIIKDFLVVTNNSQAMEKIIDSYQKKTSLEANYSYQRALRKLGKETNFARFYCHIPTIIEAIAANALSTASESSVQYRQGITGSLTLTPNSLNWRGMIWGKHGEFIQEVNSLGDYLTQFRERSLATRLPQKTLFFFSGNNLPHQWQGWGSQTDLLPLLTFGAKTIPNFINQNTGMSWQEDFLPWLGEDFALALTSISENNLINFTDGNGVEFGAALVAVAEAQDSSQGEKTLQQLDKAMGQKNQFQVKPTQQAGQPLVNWQSTLGGIEVTRGKLPGDLFFFSLGAPITSDIIPKPEHNLQSNQSFKRVMKKGLTPIKSQLFLDIENLIAKKGTLTFPEEQEDLLNAVMALGITTRVINSQSTFFEAIFLLESKSPKSPN